MYDYYNESYWGYSTVKLLSMWYSLSVILCKAVLTFKSVDETLVCEHSNESYSAVLSCGTVYYTAQAGSIFHSLPMKP